jgi:DivIVA domain-containing protein
VFFLFLVLAVLGVVFGVAAFLTGHADGMSDEPQDLAAVGIPRDRAMTPDDVIGLRFALALRGYRMNEVDDALDRLAAEVAARDEAIRSLRAELDSVRARRHGAAGAEPAEAAEAARAGSGWALDETQAIAGSADDPLAPFRPPAREPEPAAATEPELEDEVEDDDEDDDEPAYVPSDATGDLPLGTPVDVPATPEAWQEANADVPEPETPAFVEPPANPFRPEVPEIPTYDPWAVTPRSRYTEGPTYVEVEHDDDHDPTEAIAEHHTGYAPAAPSGGNTPDDVAAAEQVVEDATSPTFGTTDLPGAGGVPGGAEDGEPVDDGPGGAAPGGAAGAAGERPWQS